jgi:hypothetical protein
LRQDIDRFGDQLNGIAIPTNLPTKMEQKGKGVRGYIERAYRCLPSGANRTRPFRTAHVCF